VLEVDVLEGGGIAQLGRAQALGELALLAEGRLGVHQEAEAFVEAQARMLGRAELQLQGIDHAQELHGVHLLQRLLVQHCSSCAAA
jgi:hypothetical protein